MVLTIPTGVNITNDNVYVVKPGDSLYKIANMYGMSVNELKTLNNLTSNLLSIGQELIVKESASVPANTYIVKSGDSLYSIAKRYGITVNELKNANNKSSNMLTIGEALVIPNSSSSNYYIVKSGDTLYGIAGRYNTSVDKIKALNNLTSNALTIGQRLIIS